MIVHVPACTMLQFLLDAAGPGGEGSAEAAHVVLIANDLNVGLHGHDGMRTVLSWHGLCRCRINSRDSS